jgi:hypothetical protein
VKPTPASSSAFVARVTLDILILFLVRSFFFNVLRAGARAGIHQNVVRSLFMWAN